MTVTVRTTDDVEEELIHEHTRATLGISRVVGVVSVKPAREAAVRGPDCTGDVRDFHVKFGLPTIADGPPRWLSREERAFRTEFMDEELEEYHNAVRAGDHAGALDALVDLVYVVIGTAHFHRYPFETAWKAVQRANMAKARAASDGSNSKRGTGFDVVKPPGWVGPDVEGIIREVEIAWGNMS